MSGDEAVHVDDPQRLRALAHPIRQELLDVLQTEGTATATRCAEVTWSQRSQPILPPTHAREVRFIELAQSRGREKPWWVRHRSLTATADFDDSASVHALREVSVVVLEREAQRVRGWVARIDREPEEWVAALSIATSLFWATHAEMARVSRDLATLPDRFKDHWDDPARRPPGPRLVRLFGTVIADPPGDGPVHMRSGPVDR